MKVDLCTWTKNGTKTLLPVLKRVEEVIPHGEVRKKIAVDDSSTDNTVEILKEFNWEVYPNYEGFINGGTNEALKHVKTEFFISIEQDVLLSHKWWNVIPDYMKDEKVAVAQGIELSTNKAERALEKLKVKRLNRIPFEERSKMWSSIGNNIYRTNIIKKLGFVDDPIAMASFYKKVISHGFKWITDINVISTHLHGDTVSAISHFTRFYDLTKHHTDIDDINLLRYFAGLVASPLNGFILSIVSKEPVVLFFYPLRRLALTPTYFGRRQKCFHH